MKRILSIVLILGLVISFCGCGEVSESEYSYFSVFEETDTDKITSDSNSKKPDSTQNKKPTTQEDSADNSNISSSAEEKTETENATPSPAVKSNLPEVKFSLKDSDICFRDMVNLSDGGFAITCVKPEDSINAIIRVYDKNLNLTKEYSYDKVSFDELAVCSDGGFVTASSVPPSIIKLNSSFEIEWSTPFVDDESWGTVQDIEEISQDLIAISFVSMDSPYISRRFRIAFLNKDGELIETIDFMKNVEPSDSEIIADSKGGFYLFTACNEEFANKYSSLSEVYDNSKATEIALLHFSSDRKLTWAKTLGGGGNDWIEEATIDKDGNMYLAVGTDWYGADSFWEMGVERSMPYRRMLVKLDKNGDIVYKVPLSNKGMAVDTVFGIHIKDGVAFAVGMSDYFDGYQVKYPCEQISKNEKGERVFCVYLASFSSSGEELGRKIFRCDINDTPYDSVLLPNSSLVMAGSVSLSDNPFKIPLTDDINRTAALFKYTIN